MKQILWTMLLLGWASVSLAQEGTWTQKADMPVEKYTPGACVIDGIIYVMGGHNQKGVSTADFLAYDPATDTWAKKADYPYPKWGFDAMKPYAVDGKIYVFGGWHEGELLSKTLAYDPATDTWTEKADLPVESVDGAHAANAVDGMVYVFGGWTAARKIHSTVFAYDPATDTWTEKADLLTPRVYHDTAVVDGIIYLMGGGRSWIEIAVNVVEAYDPATDTWTEKGAMPVPLIGMACAVVDGKIYLFGGSVDGPQGAPLASVYEFTPGPTSTHIEALGWGVLKALVYR